MFALVSCDKTWSEPFSLNYDCQINVNMDLLAEAPSSDPDIKPGLEKTREWSDYTAVIPHSLVTYAMSVNAGEREQRQAAHAETSSKSCKASTPENRQTENLKTEGLVGIPSHHRYCRP